MPEGPFGGPRFNNIGTLSRESKMGIKKYWRDCPHADSRSEICKTTKFYSLKALEEQGIFPDCKTLEDINSGKCGWIAEQVYNDIPFVNPIKIMNGDHVWVEHKGLHYDAEAPQGVEDPFDLPFFHRIPPDEVLYFNEMWAEIEGREPPQSIQDMIVPVDEF